MPRRINTEYDIGLAFQAIEDELMASMVRNMKRHRAWEDAEGFHWEQWQALQLKSLERYKKQNKKRFQEQFKDINKEIESLIYASHVQGGMDQEIKILRAMQRGYKFPHMPQRMLDLLEEMDGKTFRQKASLLLEKYRGHGLAKESGEFFKVNDRKLDALIKATTNDMQKAETAVLRMANDQYRKVIYNAQVYANTGAGTYEKAVDLATKDMLSAGLNCVEYANGARHTLSDYADMAIRTASKRAYLQGEGVKRQEWGLHLVIMNKRGNPCPKCLPFVGKVLIDDVWSGGSKADGDYPLMSSAISAGLFHPRCKDGHTTYFPGISTPPDDKFSKKELAEIEDKSRQEAKQQYAARQAEKFGRLAKFSLDEENRIKYQRLSDRWKATIHDSNYSKFTDMLQDFNNGQKDTISHWSIQKNLNKSEIGKEVVKYIVEHPELNISLCYKVDAPENTLGVQDGDEIFIYASKTATIQKTAETLIHEITHHKYDIGGNQWAECVCRAQELKHRNKTDKLTGQELRDIIKSVKRDYPNLKWR